MGKRTLNKMRDKGIKNLHVKKCIIAQNNCYIWHIVPLVIAYRHSRPL